MVAHGYVDQFAYSAMLGGWLLAGWIPVTRQLAESLPMQAFTADFGVKPPLIGLSGRLAFYERPDLKGAGVGVVCLLEGPATRSEPFRQVLLWFGTQAFRMDWMPTTQALREAEVIQRCRGLLAAGFGGQADILAHQLRVDAFTGQSTFESLPEFVRLGIDEIIMCGSAGAIVLGWQFAWPGTITRHMLCTEAGVFPIDAAAMLRTERLDVLDSVGRDWGFDDSRCGFIAFVPGVQQAAGSCWFRVDTVDGRTGYATAPGRRLRGMAAIQRIMDVAELHDDDLRRAFDRVIGPACQALNEERLAHPSGVGALQFGLPAVSPRASLVIPLYGRIDYLEHQLATFSRLPPGRSWELIYVLDDPPRRREAMALAHSAFERFQLPFQLLTLEENRGFGPASNAGLRAAQGSFVCFLNSDVLPSAPGFLDRLADRLDAGAELGAVGAVLLFEDGSVQHEGMVMQPLRSRGGLRFPLHPRKGWFPRASAAVEACEMVTGACLMMDRETAEQLGGFDEGFIIGDFEDADLCARLHATGRTVAVDHGVRLFHLERQSQTQPDQRWRNSLTIFNAWLFDQRHPEAAAR